MFLGTKKVTLRRKRLQTRSIEFLLILIFFSQLLLFSSTLGTEKVNLFICAFPFSETMTSQQALSRYSIALKSILLLLHILYSSLLFPLTKINKKKLTLYINTGGGLGRLRFYGYKREVICAFHREFGATLTSSNNAPMPSNYASSSAVGAS